VAPGWHSGTNLGREKRASSTEEQLRRFEERLADRTPMRRRGQPEELVGLIIYLASDASSFVTGQVFAHDGGWSAV
jgi:NAD(P)-dependent dehydrogenase (short-subunit alcohol dehydrogenase family)